MAFGAGVAWDVPVPWPGKGRGTRLEIIMSARFNLEFPDDYKQIIRDLMTSTGLATQKDVFENSLALFGWAVREVARGRVIASLNQEDKTYNEIHMPSLMKVASSSALAGKEESNGEGASKRIEEAVRWRVLDQTIAEARGKFADLSADAVETIIDEAVAAVREAKLLKAG